LNKMSSRLFESSNQGARPPCRLRSPEDQGVKNASKDAMLKKIISVYKLKERYGNLEDNMEIIITPPRKEPQCPYRLLNILFSDRVL